MRRMDIEEFYDADQRRRESGELELGIEWTDHAGVRYELNWIEDTAELYVMREPVPYEYEDPLGDVIVDNVPVEGMTVAVIGQVPTRDDVERVLQGWEQAINAPDSVAWLISRLKESGVWVGSADAPDPD
jgi:hypothetical protein